MSQRPTPHSQFEHSSTSRNDCPETLPVVTKPWGPKEDVSLSEFQVELVQLASQLNGDHVLNTYPYFGERQTSGKQTVLQRMLFKRFLEAGREALKAGANESAIVSLLQ